MVTAGGAGDKLPNRFEHWWTALQVARLLRGEASSIHLEPLNAAGEGIEFELRLPDGPYCDQVKASGKPWTPGALVEVLRKVKAHLAAGKRVRLIVATDAPNLRGLCARARDADLSKTSKRAGQLRTLSCLRRPLRRRRMPTRKPRGGTCGWSTFCMSRRKGYSGP